MLKKVLALALMVSLAACSNPKSAQTVDKISGAGATFPAPLYTAWAGKYKEEGGVALNYQAIGSGGGIKQIEAKTVDFGATDKPLKPEELDKAGLYQFPTVMGVAGSFTSGFRATMAASFHLVILPRKISASKGPLSLSWPG